MRDQKVFKIKHLPTGLFYKPVGGAITNNCVGRSKSSGGFIWSKIKKENIYE